MTRWDLDVHGASVRVELDSLPEVAEELGAELACFPTRAPGDGPPEVHVRVRPGEAGGAPDAGGGWLGAHVTPEVWVRWRPRPAAAEVVVHGEAPPDEVVLATWARLVTASRFTGAPPRAAFHAASFAGPAGGVLLLGESGAGKTTLSRWLTHGAAAPCAYLGDEDALVELGDAPRLLPLPRRLRLLHPGDPRPPGRTFRAFGEAGWLADRPPARGQAAPLAQVVLLRPTEGGEAQLEPLPRDQLAYALLREFERFPPDHAPTPETREALVAANRDGFEASRVLAALPGWGLRYPQPSGFREAAALLAELAGA
jgi:hypothetical protein